MHNEYKSPKCNIKHTPSRSWSRIGVIKGRVACTSTFEGKTFILIHKTTKVFKHLLLGRYQTKLFLCKLTEICMCVTKTDWKQRCKVNLIIIL